MVCLQEVTFYRYGLHFVTSLSDLYCRFPMHVVCSIIFLLPKASFGLRVLSSPASVCMFVRVCVSVCVNHLLVHAITRDPFKLGSPNLDQRCKRPWLRSLLFLGVMDLDLQGKILLQSQNLPHFELVSLSAPKVTTH